MDSKVLIGDACHIAYSEVGEGQPIVLLHAWGLGRKAYGLDLGKLAKSHRVVSVDFRGHGDSDWTESGYDVGTLATDVAEIFSKLNLEYATVVGWSMGTSVATVFADLYPEHVQRLVLIGTASPVYAAREDYPMGVAHTKIEQIKSDIKSDLSRFFEVIADTLTFAVLPQDKRAQLVRIMKQADPKALVELVTDLQKLDLRPSLLRLKAPLMVIHGSNDEYSSPLAAEWIAKNHPGARVEIMSSCGHAPALEHPDHVTALIEEFIKAE